MSRIMAELKFPTLEELGKQGGEWALNEFEYKGLTIRQWADKITAGEYQPVKHGYWIKTSSPYHFKCSSCGVIANIKFNDHRFCFNCGAKMDGGENKRTTF